VHLVLSICDQLPKTYWPVLRENVTTAGKKIKGVNASGNHIDEPAELDEPTSCWPDWRSAMRP
jgi:hypothetical protein